MKKSILFAALVFSLNSAAAEENQKLSFESADALRASIQAKRDAGEAKLDILFEGYRALDNEDAIEKIGFWKIKELWAILLKEAADLDGKGLEDQLEQIDISYRNARALIKFTSNVNYSYDESGAKKNDFYYLVRAAYLKIRSQTQQKFPDVELWNHEINHAERQKWIDEIWVPAVLELKDAYVQQRISEMRTRANAEAVISYFIGGIAGFNGGIERDTYESLFSLLNLAEKSAHVSIPVEIKEAAINLYFPRRAANAEWIEKTTKEFADLDLKDSKAVDFFLLNTLKDIQSEISDHEGFRSGVALVRFRTLNTFFFTAYYPQLLANRPPLETLEGLITAENARGNLSDATSTAYQRVLRVIRERS